MLVLTPTRRFSVFSVGSAAPPARAPPPPAPAAATRARVLLIHGYTSDGAAFRARCAGLAKKALKGLDLVAPDAPRAVCAAHALPGAARAAQRAWFHPADADADARVRPATSVRWDGWREALAALVALVDAPGAPWAGAVAFSQGAPMAALLCAARPGLFRFVVSAGGFAPRDPDAAAALARAAPLGVASLHCAGANDPLVPRERTGELAALFAGGALLDHDGAHQLPPNSLHAAIRDFVAAALAAPA